MRRAALLAALAALAGAAMAQEAPDLPAAPFPGVVEVAAGLAGMRSSCEGAMTLLREDCTAVHQFACPALGGKRLHVIEGPDGILLWESNDADYGLGPSVRPAGGHGWLRVIEATRPFSLAALLRDGHSLGSYVMEWDDGAGLRAPSSVRFEATLTDDSRTLGPVTFRLAELRMRIGRPSTVEERKGQLLIDEGRGLIFTDFATSRLDGGAALALPRARAAILPGAPGFLEPPTAAACATLLSTATPHREPPHG